VEDEGHSAEWPWIAAAASPMAITGTQERVDVAEMLTIGWIASPDQAARSQTVKRLQRLSERILERRGGRPLPDSACFIRAERDRMADRGGP